MDAREQRGLAIAATTKIQGMDGKWIVPSQSGNGRYIVNSVGDDYRCTCPDFMNRNCKCKHIYAVEYFIQREQTLTVETDDCTGETVVTATETVTVSERRTYPQNWAAYNAAQTNEKAWFLSLLHDLCSGVPEPIQQTNMGRPRLPYSDMIFAAAYKVYSTVSGRRFMTDLSDAVGKGYLTKSPHFNSIFNYLEMDALTPILQELIQQSAAPLGAVETDFAVDGSGFGTTRFIKWLDVKHHGVESRHDWVKVHLICGVKTNIVTAVEVSDRLANDSPYLPTLVNRTASQFSIKEVSADKAYASYVNHSAIDKVGAQSFIAFKSHHTMGKFAATKEGGKVWQKMFHYFKFNQEEYMEHYHKRSNVESTFSMIKAKFGDGLRSKTPVAQINEALCKVLCHNICVVIQSMYELGIEPTFANAT